MAVNDGNATVLNQIDFIQIEFLVRKGWNNCSSFPLFQSFFFEKNFIALDLTSKE